MNRPCFLRHPVDLHSRTGRHLGFWLAHELVSAGGSCQNWHNRLAFILDRGLWVSRRCTTQSNVVLGNLRHNLWGASRPLLPSPKLSQQWLYHRGCALSLTGYKFVELNAGFVIRGRNMITLSKRVQVGQHAGS